MDNVESIFIKDLEKRIKPSDPELFIIVENDTSEGFTISLEALSKQFQDFYRSNLIGTITASFASKLDHALFCDGRLVRKEGYPKLWANIGDIFGRSDEDPEDSFRLPDLRGRFIRGAENPNLAGILQNDGILNVALNVRESNYNSRELELCFGRIFFYLQGSYPRYIDIVHSIDSGVNLSICALQFGWPPVHMHNVLQPVYTSSWGYEITYDYPNKLTIDLGRSLVPSFTNSNRNVGEVRPINIPVNYFIYCE